MLKIPRYSLLVLLIIIPMIGFGFPSNAGYEESVIADPLPLVQEGSGMGADKANSVPIQQNISAPQAPYQQASSSTPPPSPTSTPPPTITATTTQIATATPAIVKLDIRFKPVLYVFVRAPQEIVDQPYVILSAYRSVPTTKPLLIKGKINNGDFSCPDTPCRLPVTANAQIQFQAEDQLGGTSSEVRATVRVEQRAEGYYVSLEQVSQFFAQQDACGAMWGFKPNEMDVDWSYFPQQPEQLATQKTLHYLAGQLIRSGIVDASSCPGKGFHPQGYPNQCGLEKAKPAMIAWQNSFDFDIWLAAKDLRIPPRPLKVLIETESQFWPSNARGYVDEIGLGQVNQLGIDVLLRQDPALYQLICPAVLGSCSIPYSAQPEEYQKMIRGALLNSMNAYCPTCPNGIDMSVTHQSVTTVGLLLRANCKLVDQVMELYEAEASYEDHWKFTLVTYHSGLSCVENAIEKLTDINETTDWAHVARWMDCRGASDYAERVWTSLTTFDDYRIKTTDDGAVSVSANILPTPTPIPTIGPPPSNAVVWVIVILDENQNGIPEDSEWVNGIEVSLRRPDGTELKAVTTNGKAVFDLKGYTTGTELTASLPSLYRSASFFVPERGIVPIVFVFMSPSFEPTSP